MLRDRERQFSYSSVFIQKQGPRASYLQSCLRKPSRKSSTPVSNLDSKRDWHLRLPEVLWAYRTTYRTPTQATPYSLVFGAEAVLPLEGSGNSIVQDGRVHRRGKHAKGWIDALDETRLAAQQNLELDFISDFS